MTMKTLCVKMSFVSFLLCFLLLRVVVANAGAADFKIGVVDISGVFEKYEKRKVLDKELKELEKGFQNEINQKRKEMINLDEETQLLDLGSDSRKKNEDLLERKNVELEGYAKFAERQLLRTYRERFGTVYGIVVNEVESIG